MDNNTTQNQGLDEYIEKLISEKGFPDLTDEVKAEIKSDLLKRVDEFITARVTATLSDEDVLKFEEMLKSGKSENEIQHFISISIPDFNTFLTNTLMEFRGVYLGIITPPQSSESQPVNGSSNEVPPPLEPAPVAEDSTTD